MWNAILRPCLVCFVILAVLTGIAYPMLMTAAAQLLFPHQANGSLITSDGKPAAHASQAAGSALIGQSFAGKGYFWSRLSATSPAYNADGSSGSNFGPTSPNLLSEVTGAVGALELADPKNKKPIPIDLVTSSASGLDPDISPASAYYQVGRVARARHLSRGAVKALVAQCVRGRWLGVFGAAHVNVLRLNMRLNKLSAMRH